MKLKFLKKLWKFFCYFVLAKKIWHWPRQSEVIIFDATGQEVLLEYLGQWRPEVLHVFGEEINVPVLFASFFKGGKRINAYVDSFIKRVRPRLIVTFIDNSSVFYSIAARHPNLKSMFIQNGTRGAEVFEELDRTKASGNVFKVDYMMTFGSDIGSKYSKYIQGAVVPIGSLRNNLFPKSRLRKNDTIAFISQYRNTKGFVWGGKFRTREEFFERADQLVLRSLLDYARMHGKQLRIVPCAGEQENPVFAGEKAYYRRLLGEEIEFAPPRNVGTSYESIDDAEVVISIDSTLGYESAARGNKTAFFPIRALFLNLPDRAFGWPRHVPDEGPFWTNCLAPGAFARILDHLFAIDDSQWREELSAHDFAKIIAYDPGNSILQSVLQKELISRNSQFAVC